VLVGAVRFGTRVYFSVTYVDCWCDESTTMRKNGGSLVRSVVCCRSGGDRTQSSVTVDNRVSHDSLSRWKKKCNTEPVINL